MPISMPPPVFHILTLPLKLTYPGIESVSSAMPARIVSGMAVILVRYFDADNSRIGQSDGVSFGTGFPRSRARNKEKSNERSTG